jgi:exodeoxyribonuclease III
VLGLIHNCDAAGKYHSNIFGLLIDVGVNVAFGLALRSLAADEGASHSTAQTFLGTPAYMSPEQLEGRAATPASDTYALGLVMYEMVTGARPFQGDTPISAALKRLTEAPAPPRRFQPGLSGEWESVILRCLERDSMQRFANVAEIPAALKDQTGSSFHSVAGTQPERQAALASGTLDALLLTGRQKYLRFIRQAVSAVVIAITIMVVIFGYRTWRNRARESSKSVEPEQLGAPQARVPVGSSTSSRPAVRIAVLPFESRPDSPEVRNLSSTIADELASELGQAARNDVRVLAANSISGYTPTKTMPAQVVQELRAQYLVEGTIDCFNRKGERSWNGVAILARNHVPVLTCTTLPGHPEDHQARYIEAAVQGVLITSIYLPNGNPQPGPKFNYKLAWFERLIAHAAELMASGAPVVLAGDYNVVPTPQDIYPTRSLDNNALIQPESRQAFARLLAQGWTDALRKLHPDGPLWTFWDYKFERWQKDKGMRLDHFLLSPICRSG